ncbi:hypothetical protein AADQ47_001953 [Campylobacter jejuni]
MPEKGKTFAGEVREETVAWSKDTYQLLKQAEQGKVKSYVQDIAVTSSCKFKRVNTLSKIIKNYFLFLFKIVTLKNIFFPKIYKFKHI